MNPRRTAQEITELEAAFEAPAYWRCAHCNPPLLAGQETLSVATVSSHTYEGPGHCRADIYGTICRAHRDEHELIDEDDLP